MSKVSNDEKCYRTINGGYCTAGQRLGYCWLDKHRGCITKAIFDKHQCAEKSCTFFQKYDEAPYWVEKEKRKNEKKNKKIIAKQENKCREEILSLFQDATKELENFAIIDIKKEGKVYVASFVALQWVPVQEIIEEVKTKCKEKVLMRGIHTDNQRKCALLSKYGCTNIKKEGGDKDEC